jgi:hypothetical protein
MKTDDVIEGLKVILKSDKYKDARKKINAWKERLRHADVAETKTIEEETTKFFSAMEASTPALYKMFRVDRNVISGQITKKLTGHDVIID